VKVSIHPPEPCHNGVIKLLHGKADHQSKGYRLAGGLAVVADSGRGGQLSATPASGKFFISTVRNVQRSSALNFGNGSFASCGGFLLPERCGRPTELALGDGRCRMDRSTMDTAEVPSTADIVELPWGPINPRAVDDCFWDVASTLRSMPSRDSAVFVVGELGPRPYMSAAFRSSPSRRQSAPRPYNQVDRWRLRSWPPWIHPCICKRHQLRDVPPVDIRYLPQGSRPSR
jgi:hypothetical protein